MAFTTVAIVGGATVLVGSAIDAGIKNKRANDAATAATNMYKDEIQPALDNREPVYDASGKIREMKTDIDEMKGLVTNPYANLGVATEAAEIQMEQSDIALANTLDTIAATGAGAGGATALAQAALQSKRGVAADIQRQEAQNQKLRAQGEQQANQQLLSLEQQKLRLEGQAISAEERAAIGRADREQAEIDRLYGEYDFQRSQEIANRAAASDAIIGGLQTVGGAGLSIAGAGLAPTPSAINPTQPPNTLNYGDPNFVGPPSEYDFMNFNSGGDPFASMNLPK